MEQQEPEDVEFDRSLLTRKMEAGTDVVMQTDRAAVLHNMTCPKAQYHFIVLAKENIVNVTALRREHLPLLEHMMELANQIMEKQDLPSNKFKVGFKMNAFMNRLNMHVISNDFHAPYMRRIEHWNTFNSHLFITFQVVYALLRVQGCVKAMSPDNIEKLRTATPVRCNQCPYIARNFMKFKEHLYNHWRLRERMNKMDGSNLVQSMGNMNLNGNSQPNPNYRRHFMRSNEAHPASTSGDKHSTFNQNSRNHKSNPAKTELNGEKASSGAANYN